MASARQPADHLCRRASSDRNRGDAGWRVAGPADRDRCSGTHGVGRADDPLHGMLGGRRKEGDRARTEPSVSARPQQCLHESSTVEFGVGATAVMIEADHDHDGSVGEMRSVRSVGGERRAHVRCRDDEELPRLAIASRPAPPSLVEELLHQTPRRRFSRERSCRLETKVRHAPDSYSRARASPQSPTRGFELTVVAHCVPITT